MRTQRFNEGEKTKKKSAQQNAIISAEKNNNHKKKNSKQLVSEGAAPQVQTRSGLTHRKLFANFALRISFLIHIMT